MVQTIQLTTEMSPVAVHLVVDVPVVQLQGPRRCCAAATSSSCWSRQLGCGVDFFGPCTLVQGREPSPQGHGSHN